MSRGAAAPNTWLWTIAAMAGLAWGLIGVFFASLGPHALVPRVFSNYHVEHFAAFYVLTLLAAAALPRMRLLYVASGVAGLALLLGVVRALVPHHWVANAEDLAADLIGVICAAAPILIGRFRHLVVEGEGPTDHL